MFFKILNNFLTLMIDLKKLRMTKFRFTSLIITVIHHCSIMQRTEIGQILRFG